MGRHAVGRWMERGTESAADSAAEVAAPTAPAGATPGAAATGALTALTMVAFAANSLLCREALAAGAIDPVAFTTLRVVSGAALLLPLAPRLDRPRRPAGAGAASAGREGSLRAALTMYLYAITFALAYVTLDAGVGALIMFGAVQATMIGAGLRRGERPRPVQWVGLAVAVVGLVALLRPGAAAPDLFGVALMITAGVTWGLYTLHGRGSTRPLATTAGNFGRAAPLALAAGALAAATAGLQATAYGALLAVTSGALTSGLGYALWYRALRGHTATTAAISQLSVPVIAAAGGVLLLGEALTARLVVGGALVLGGVAAASWPRRAASS